MVTECKPHPTLESNRPAYALYRAFLKEGVTCKEMDKGHRVTNYAGKYCRGKERSCIIGAGDNFTTPMESFRFGFTNYDETLPNGKRVQKIVDGVFGKILPIATDDLDPNTEYDADVRKSIRHAISLLTLMLANLAGDKSYREKLAIGLHHFIAEPKPEDRLLKDFDKRTLILGDIGLASFRDYLKKNGGLRFADPDFRVIKSTLKALKTNSGGAHNLLHLLYAAFKTAGLKPSIYMATSEKRMKSEPLFSATRRLCVGLIIRGKLRLFDPAFFQDDAKYKDPVELGLRQYLSIYYSNKGLLNRIRKKHSEAIKDYNQALELDPMNIIALYGRGLEHLLLFKDREAVQDFGRALEINPKFYLGFDGLGMLWALRGNYKKALVYYKKSAKLYPKGAIARFNIGNLYLTGGRQKAALQELTEYIHFVSGRKSYAEIVPARLIELVARSFTPRIATAIYVGKKADKEFMMAYKSFGKETIFDLARIEAQFLFVCTLWKSVLYDHAKYYLEGLENVLQFKKPPSKTIKIYLKKLIETVRQTTGANRETACYTQKNCFGYSTLKEIDTILSRIEHKLAS